MNKAYLFALMMLIAPLTGCIELDDLTEENSTSLEDAFNGLIDSITTENWRKYCKYVAFTVDDETNTISLANNTELDECAEYDEEHDNYESKLTASNYTEKNLDYKAANNSGSVYSVNAIIEDCEREDEFEPWDCDDPNDESILWVKVDGQWLFGWDRFVEEGESAPIATFFVEEGGDGIYYVDVIKVTRQEDLAGFSFFLKDDTGSTYVGGNGFGEIAMQMINGYEHGIDESYNGDDEQLSSRANNVTSDDGSEFPVHFSDNDRDGTLSAGDQFMVYGSGDGANGPAADNWRLDIQFDASGDIIGSATLL